MPRVRVSQEDINRNRLVEPGLWYNVEVMAIVDELSKKGDSTNTNVDFQVLDGPFKGAMLYRTFNEKAPGFFIPFLKAFGTEVVADQDYDLNALIGRRIKVFVKHREYNNQIFNDVADFKPLE